MSVTRYFWKLLITPKALFVDASFSHRSSPRQHDEMRLGTHQVCDVHVLPRSRNVLRHLQGRDHLARLAPLKRRREVVTTHRTRRESLDVRRSVVGRDLQSARPPLIRVTTGARAQVHDAREATLLDDRRHLRGELFVEKIFVVVRDVPRAGDERTRASRARRTTYLFLSRRRNVAVCFNVPRAHSETRSYARYSKRCILSCNFRCTHALSRSAANCSFADVKSIIQSQRKKKYKR